MGFSGLLADMVREHQPDVNQGLRWSDGKSLLDSLVPDSQLVDQQSIKGSIDTRPLCSLFAFGLDPTLITPPHSARRCSEHDSR